jgi:predicted amidohydrolase
MRIAMVSLDQVWEAPASNLAACRQHAARAVELGAELVVFPELTLTGFTMDATSFAEDPDGSPTIGAFSALAAEQRVHIAFGVALRGRERPRNTLVVVDRDGGEVARYAKVHPFTYAGESESYEAGEDLVVARLDDVAIGLSICYDLRFPGMFAALAPRCDALLCIANWPGRRVRHWEALLQARAIEGQCCVFGVNRTGTDGNGIEYPASSHAFDARGDVLPVVAEAGEVKVVAMDPATTAEYRAAFPVLRDARPDVYGH